MEHLHVCSTSLKMLNRIYPLMGIINSAFGSICLSGRCTIVKSLQANKILEGASLQEETWWLLSADASLKPGEKPGCLIGPGTHLCWQSTRVVMQGPRIAKSLNSSCRTGVRCQALHIQCNVVDAQIMKILVLIHWLKVEVFVLFDPKCVLIFSAFLKIQGRLFGLAVFNPA